MVRYRPDGYHDVSPYLVLDQPEKLLAFAEATFGAEEIERIATPDGTVMHAETRVGDSIVMIGHSSPEHPAVPAMLYVYVGDVDATFKKAVEAGGEVIAEPVDQFWGDRYCGVRDPAGTQWWIATHVEDVSPEEIARRAQQMHQ